MIVRRFHGKLAVFDLSGTGTQIGEKLALLLDEKQRKELAQYLFGDIVLTADTGINPPKYNWQQDSPLTEIQEGDLYICLEHRLVTVHKQEISLTAKEFDILFLLASNPKRVFTYELIMDLVWNEDYTYYSRKAINNHVSNLRKKLKTRPDDPDYIKSATGIGYKFALQ
ncbi:response regulator transcription factor [Blautia pseudococcoides]|uniref:winged helix-turn-helix domain-containing protein n=1 Tax=Blautia pseudococcoides TaxID=1796616 RepID=UPI00148AE64C|nr:response regulator transcription factor [Blautia pseudococcoides]QJU13629.1 response regulator transcription factor [Blautia pseudococcoides]